MELALNVIAFVFLLAPVMVQVVKLLAVITRNKRMEVLANRAYIIVESLESNATDNLIKSTQAKHKLAAYALEVGIPLTPDQVDDYIESAVFKLKEMSSNVKKA